jgi:hypothetical protein
MDLHRAIPLATVGIGCLVLFAAQLYARTRHAARAVRIAFLLAGPIGLAWSSIGFYLLYQPSHNTHRYFVLDHIKYNLAGALLGIFATLLLNPEFYRRRKHLLA